MRNCDRNVDIFPLKGAKGYSSRTSNLHFNDQNKPPNLRTPFIMTYSFSIVNAPSNDPIYVQEVNASDDATTRR